MKRILLFFLIACILCGLAIPIAGYLSAPVLADATGVMAEGGYLALPKEIVQVDEEGHILASFPTKETATLMTMDGDDLIFGYLFTGLWCFDRWDGETITNERVLDDSLLNRVTQIAPDGDKLMVAGFQNGGASVSVFTEGEADRRVSQYDTTNLYVSDVAMVDGGVAVQTELGSVYLLLGTDAPQQIIAPGTDGFLVKGNPVAYYGAEDNTLQYLEADKVGKTPSATCGTWISNAGDWTLTTEGLYCNATQITRLQPTLQWSWDAGLAFLWYLVAGSILGSILILRTMYILANGKTMWGKLLCLSLWYLTFLLLAIFALPYMVLPEKYHLSLLTSFFLFTLVYWMIVRHITMKLDKLAKFSEKLSDGRYELRQDISQSDEVGRLARSLNHMAATMETMRYNSIQTVKAYMRFVPENIRAMMKKGEKIPVNDGVARSLTSMVGVAAVTNRGQIRSQVQDETFTTWMMDVFATVDQVASHHGAVATTTARSLQGIQMLLQNPADALHMGMELTTRQRGIQQVQGIHPQTLFLVHHGNFVYGLGGGEENAFVFLVSQELEVLQQYQDRLGAANVQMVVTAQALEHLPSTVETRYLGFVGQGNLTFKLYEVLNVLGDLEKAVKKQTREELGQALKLFYQRDFYLARNQFSQILKKNPKDGIARWYVFACDQAFRDGMDEEGAFGLFAEGKVNE